MIKTKSNGLVCIQIIIGLSLMVSTGCRKDGDFPNVDIRVLPETITDVDGNQYHVIAFDKQEWLLENLKVTKFNDLTPIPNIADSVEWCKTKTPAYCYYNNDSTSYKDTYGALYNWYVINTGKIAPKGWHVATLRDWEILIRKLGGIDYAPYRLRDQDTLHWEHPSLFDAVGFKALPTGGRNGTNLGGTFFGERWFTSWWNPSNEESVFIDSAKGMILSVSACDNIIMVWTEMNQHKNSGASIRCVRD